ncbi:Mitochondrial ribosomal protein MRP51 [Penicillium brevicompactum]|uniref:Mitochondrial ribosomal protein MRP51 n=1 Tax=Penicillium brevicompactum TaxID=5074 RepID=A0A9W9QPB1_PENBR|nr:Mitochondrial ribosomal protein MRP51 [Penicillium brevicompactum]
MASARLSPTANLLRKSRLFSLPKSLKAPVDPASSRAVSVNESATLPHPIRAAIATPSSSLARGDWGLKRPLPAKSTSDKSSKPVVRLHALDTYEHVTDFESAADHTMTLEKFQELHMPISLPYKVHYSAKSVPKHDSPFELDFDNTETSEGVNAKRFRQTGPWLAGQTESEFLTYLDQVTSRKPELLQKLRTQYTAQRNAELRKQAQDNGEDISTETVTTTDAEFDTYIRTLRKDPNALGLIIFDLLDLVPSPALPAERVGQVFFQAPVSNMASSDYATSGPPKTHPSAGLSYTRSHALIHNHPEFGPQAEARPVEARILRPKGKFKGKPGRGIGSVGGIAVDDLNFTSFRGADHPPGLLHFDASLPGGGKYWARPIRAHVDSQGRIRIASYRASPEEMIPYGLKEFKKESTLTISDVTEDNAMSVPRLDKASLSQPRFTSSSLRPSSAPTQDKEDVARSLLDKISR